MAQIIDALRDATDRLAAAGSDTPRLDADVLMRHVLGIDRTQLFLRYHDALEDDDAVAFLALVNQRADHLPIAYLTGSREFMGIPFRTTPDALIPRPETELLVEWALHWLRDRPTATVVDIGTGSGAIAVAIAAHVDSAFAGQIIATDVSPAALNVARSNAERLPEDRQALLTFRQGSLLEPIDIPVDLLLANLPYLTPAQIEENPFLAAEPRLALDGGDDGLDLVRTLISGAAPVLTNGGALGLELDPSQTTLVADLLHRAYPHDSIDTIVDLAQFSRHVVLTR